MSNLTQEITIQFQPRRDEFWIGQNVIVKVDSAEYLCKVSARQYDRKGQVEYTLKTVKHITEDFKRG